MIYLFRDWVENIRLILKMWKVKLQRKIVEWLKP